MFKMPDLGESKFNNLKKKSRKLQSKNGMLRLVIKFKKYYYYKTSLILWLMYPLTKCLLKFPVVTLVKSIRFFIKKKISVKLGKIS